MSNMTLEQKHRLKRKIKTAMLTIVIFGIAIFYFSPILYMFLSAFKTEHQAVMPMLFFQPTLETIKLVLSDRNMFGYLKNSLFQVFFTTLVCLLLAIPASFALVFGKFRKKTTGESAYLWFITTILLPPVAVIIPLYTWYQKFNLIKSPLGLLIAYIGFHVPIVVWMLHSFFKDVPVSI
ncbi:MAG: carbohydrate ABC transporter permease, partial [Spirochaetales bacterium]|nr:carbohydrate ABC transporter permease [Spirochaetales bacterium]